MKSAKIYGNVVIVVWDIPVIGTSSCRLMYLAEKKWGDRKMTLYYPGPGVP